MILSILFAVNVLVAIVGGVVPKNVNVHLYLFADKPHFNAFAPMLVQVAGIVR
jgi:hypothetical protein